MSSKDNIEKVISDALPDRWLQDVADGKIPISAGMAIMPTETEDGRQGFVLFHLPEKGGYPMAAQAAGAADMLGLAMNIINCVHDVMVGGENNDGDGDGDGDDDGDPTKH